MGINGYLTKFKIDSLNDHTDFTTASLTMNALSAGTDDIISQSGVAKPQSQILISSPTTTPTSSTTITSLEITYTVVSIAYSDVYFWSLSGRATWGERTKRGNYRNLFWWRTEPVSEPTINWSTPEELEGEITLEELVEISIVWEIASKKDWDVGSIWARIRKQQWQSQ